MCRWRAPLLRQARFEPVSCAGLAPRRLVHHGRGLVSGRRGNCGGRSHGAHAPERIVWGTNWPHNAARETADYPDDAALLDLAMSWLPDEAARVATLVDSPQQLYGFPPVG